MKKLFVAVCFIGCIGNSAKAGLLDPIQATLIDHVEVVAQVDDEGNERLSLLDSIIRIGSHNGESLIHLQAGFSGDTKPEPGQSANWIVGGMFRLDPFLKSIELPEHWKFLHAVEIGVGSHYDYETEDWYPNLTVGLGFRLNPVE